MPIALLENDLQDLIRRVASGDEGAFGALYDASRRRVFGLALRILRDAHAAEEATLEVFAQVWRESGRYDAAQGSVLAWIVTLARTRAIDLLRSRSRVARREGRKLEEGGDALDRAPGPAESARKGERAERVRAAVRALPIEQRRAIEASYFGGLSYSEAAGLLGEPVGTVKTRIRAGMATLRRALAPEGEDPE